MFRCDADTSKRSATQRRKITFVDTVILTQKKLNTVAKLIRSLHQHPIRNDKKIVWKENFVRKNNRVYLASQLILSHESQVTSSLLANGVMHLIHAADIENKASFELIKERVQLSDPLGHPKFDNDGKPIVKDGYRILVDLQKINLSELMRSEITAKLVRTCEFLNKFHIQNFQKEVVWKFNGNFREHVRFINAPDEMEFQAIFANPFNIFIGPFVSEKASTSKAELSKAVEFSPKPFEKRACDYTKLTGTWGVDSPNNEPKQMVQFFNFPMGLNGSFDAEKPHKPHSFKKIQRFKPSAKYHDYDRLVRAPKSLFEFNTEVYPHPSKAVVEGFRTYLKVSEKTEEEKYFYYDTSEFLEELYCLACRDLGFKYIETGSLFEAEQNLKTKQNVAHQKATP